MIRRILFSFGLAAGLMLAAGTSVRATITGISADGCGGTTCLPSFVAPIVAGIGYVDPGLLTTGVLNGKSKRTG